MEILFNSTNWLEQTQGALLLESTLPRFVAKFSNNQKIVKVKYSNSHTGKVQIVGQMAAALMAVSPFGIYLAQETRHYTLAILLNVTSLGFFVVAIDKIQQKTPLPFCMISCPVVSERV